MFPDALWSVPYNQAVNGTMSKVSKITLVLFVLAMACYMLSFTGVAFGLAVFGFFFEFSMYISMFSDYKKKSHPV